MSLTRVRIHSPGPADEGDYLAAVRASKSLHHPWLSLSDTSEAFAAYLERYALKDQRAYLIREIETDKLVGFVNANNIVRGAFRSTFLGYAAFSGGEGRV